MKNFFIRLLITILVWSVSAEAGIRPITEAPAIPPISAAEQEKNLRDLYKEIPDLTNAEAVQKYLEKRLAIVTPANMTAEEAAIASATSSIDPTEFNKKQENTLSAYEKIYQESMNRAADADSPIDKDVTLDGTFYRLTEETTNMQPLVPDFPYVTIKLSDEKEILAPAEEHIAYLLTSINVEPNGLLRISEEFIFVSNNEGFPQGFFRLLPKYGYSREGSKRRLDISLDSVTINGEEYPYKITEIGDHLYIEPVKPLSLPTGIYTYQFNYIIDRAIWFYDDFDEFYWDISARTLKNVVGSANAVVILPTGKTFLAQNAIASTRQGLNLKRVTITSISLNSLGFADTEALAVGDDIHLYITLEKGVIVEPDLTQKFMGMIQDYGMIIFALLAFVAIFISYKISYTQIRRNLDKTRASVKKTPALFRLINSNVFDIRSFGAEILSLTAKNIVELKTREDTSVLIKKTDNLKALNRIERKTISLLFPGAETVLPATAESHLKLERTFKYLNRAIKQTFQIYQLKLNGLYLAFSLSMLLCGIIGASTIAVNPSHTFWVILVSTILLSPFVILLALSFDKKWLNYIIKVIAIAAILCIAGTMAIYTSNLYAAIITATIYLIVFYYRRFSQRSGLLRNKIKETEDYKNYLQKDPELEKSKRDFNTKIAYIFAFNLEKKYGEIDKIQHITPILQQLDTNFNKGKI